MIEHTLIIHDIYSGTSIFNEPRFNELLGITNNIFRPGKSYSKMSGTEPRFNELLDLTI